MGFPPEPQSGNALFESAEEEGPLRKRLDWQAANRFAYRA